jgi:hypothetical protein
MKFDYDRLKFDCNVRFNWKFDYVRLKLTKFDYVTLNLSEIWLCYIEFE